MTFLDTKMSKVKFLDTLSPSDFSYFEAVKDSTHVQNLDQGEKGEFSEHEGNPGSKDIVKYYRYYFVFLLQIIIFNHVECTIYIRYL